MADQVLGSGAMSAMLAILSLSIFVSAIYAAVLLPLVAVVRLVAFGSGDVLGWALLLLVVVLTATPLEWMDGEWPARAMTFVTGAAVDYFPMRVKLEDEDALKPGRPYVLGYEPHSALPVGIPAVFSCASPALPKFLRGPKFHALASGVCFQVPFVRQLWWWLGLRAATRPVIDGILSAGGSVMLCPGGVQECLNMELGSELVFLRARKGFVRIALTHGAALVPVFAFGQGGAYHWSRPGPPLVPQAVINWMSRRAGAVPLTIYGRWFTPVPHRVPITIVVGRPIDVPPAQSNPPDALVDEYLSHFIAQLEAMYEQHKGGTPCEDMPLRVM